jgi:16S rRNA (cytidine1402-2'-O)-methyltransferase
MAGVIYLVSTPIGNLGDITIRALETLKSVDVIAAEDTRQTLKLLNRFEIKKPLVSYHEHNKKESGEKIINEALAGKNFALVTDAGTPGISDPGEALVQLAIENNVPVYLIPGPTAFVYGLVVSGLPTARFVFEGFLPTDKKGKRERLEAIKDEEKTIIFYEAPHKLIRTLNDLYENLGDRKIALCRELTKKYEEIIRCRLSEAIEIYKEKKPLGEYVIIMEGRDKKEVEKEKQMQYESISIEEHVKMYMNEGMDKKDAIKRVAKERNLPKSEVYKCSIDI